MEAIWTWILNNSSWLIPLIILVGNEVVKWTPTEKDNDVFKVISYLLEKIANSKNKSKRGKDFSVYPDEESKPNAAKLIDRIAEEVLNKINKKNKFSKNGRPSQQK